MKNIVIGTAGHIDHGKTTLIKALTGRETDTLAEEKKRGISINLGFTYFDLPSKKRAGIVDVPGHEKFIKNMLAGASGLDMVLFVIGADEGVMPQTIEHLDILKFLNVKNGIIVLTKCDTVDEEFIELVKEDVIEKVKGTFLEDADIIEVDSISKRGIDKLINKIDEISKDIEDNDISSPARLNIDRVFSVKGFGTVITGTLTEGKISVEDDLMLYPSNIETKIRSIQVHGENVNTAYAGQRTAINISNVKVEDLKRGDVLGAKNSLEESMMLDVKISIVNHSNKSLKHWDRLRLYHGTKEILCRAVPLDKEIINSSEDGYVQLRLEESIVAKKGDKFVIRSYSPMETIGGGTIIDTNPKKHKKFDTNVINSLKIKEKGELKDILEEYLKKNTEIYPSKKEIMAYIGENEENVDKALQELINMDKAICINSMYMHINKYETLKFKSVDLLTKYHKSYRLRNGMVKEEFRSKVEGKFKTKEMDLLIDKLSKEKVVKVNDNLISLYEFEVRLNSKQLEIKNTIKNQLNSSMNKSENILTIDGICNKNKFYEEVLESMIGQEVEQLDEKHVIDKELYETLKNNLINYLKENKEITLGEYRDLLNSSRKNCVILLENFDRNKITKRKENSRVLF
ncbi:selenocysteine-specific translation elongation factor [Romboutsia sp. 1001216sp1]|uniref:selenocysteine-specific translation elongation factor n=1 Tax=Romboutsia TaxID=1501226 RepID=UPI000AAC2CAA|nr:MULTISPECIES: selenocysteine-specific translation elongation factor [Romboutsia]MDB8792190.1 selenocysteine-specific translation elongation factor [Romboutsia sp. 1001216sp1]MDB8797157.1 selenocysteine-specific translation elongation factor [Romboutsia sp. 1001216sp1]MDB8798637.1 selenocysteine-specific translation elongation factor [Romboutsia sp. 1001216sp1]MDB8804071.1 selenocysteine-specific translation elongation factor [Romboutsia sp. 1001216sp1]MDB8807249.1 selenocysteine-specific tr